MEIVYFLDFKMRNIQLLLVSGPQLRHDQDTGSSHEMFYPARGRGTRKCHQPTFYEKESHLVCAT